MIGASPDFAASAERAAGAGFSGSQAANIARRTIRIEEEDETSPDEALSEMERYPNMNNQDCLIEALRYALTHLPQRHVDHINHILNP